MKKKLLFLVVLASLLVNDTCGLASGYAKKKTKPPQEIGVRLLSNQINEFCKKHEFLCKGMGKPTKSDTAKQNAEKVFQRVIGKTSKKLGL